MKKLKSILLIEDDEATNFLHKMLLEDMDVVENISIARNGQEALDYLNKCQFSELPELIFLDVNMPYMDGFEFLDNYEHLAHERKNGVLIMMVTTSSNPRDLNRAKKYGKYLKGYMQKPLNEDHILEIWNQHFND